jgi:hypothetical protein
MGRLLERDPWGIHCWGQRSAYPEGDERCIEGACVQQAVVLGSDCPHALATKVTGLAGSFLWVGHLERLAWQELHHRKKAGDLGVSCIFSRGQALFSKQLCHQVVAGDTPAAHQAFWLGHVVATSFHGLLWAPMYRTLQHLMLMLVIGWLKSFYGTVVPNSKLP